MKKSDKPLEFKTAFRYPFNRAKGMLNIFWILVPIFGWFALGGYGVRIVQEFIKGKFKELPEMKVGDDFKLGFFMFLKALPFMIVYVIFSGIISFIPGSKVLMFLIELFIIPILGINFFKKMSVESFFEFSVVKSVSNNIGDYLITLLKSLGLALVFLVMYIILIGIPAQAFTQNMFLADFYRRRVK